MNPLKKDAATRTKQDIDSIKHVYLDLDHGGLEALETIQNSTVVPRPSYVLKSSPEPTSKTSSVPRDFEHGRFGTDITSIACEGIRKTGSMGG